MWITVVGRWALGVWALGVWALEAHVEARGVLLDEPQQRLGLGLKRGCVLLPQLRERLEGQGGLLALALALPRSGYPPVDQERRLDPEVLRDDERAVLVVEQPRSVRVGEDEVVELRQQPHRGRGVGVGARRIREVEERAPADREAFEVFHALERAGRPLQPRPRLHVGRARRP